MNRINSENIRLLPMLFAFLLNFIAKMQPELVKKIQTPDLQ